MGRTYESHTGLKVSFHVPNRISCTHHLPSHFSHKRPIAAMLAMTCCEQGASFARTDQLPTGNTHPRQAGDDTSRGLFCQHLNRAGDVSEDCRVRTGVMLRLRVLALPRTVSWNAKLLTMVTCQNVEEWRRMD